MIDDEIDFADEELLQNMLSAKVKGTQTDNDSHANFQQLTVLVHF